MFIFHKNKSLTILEKLFFAIHFFKFFGRTLVEKGYF